MSGNGCPKCDGTGGDEARRAILGPRWSEQTQALLKCTEREREVEKQEVKRKPLNTRVHAMQSVDNVRAYIVAFCQEVKCKAICFSCCRKNRYSIWNIKYSQTGQLK